MKLFLLLVSLLSGQGDVDPKTGLFRCDHPRFIERDVPRLRYALELRDELRKMGRLCDHPEDWDRTVRAIAEGATLIEMAVCHHEKKTRRTLYRVTARWMEERDYPQASVVEGVDRR